MGYVAWEGRKRAVWLRGFAGDRCYRAIAAVRGASTRWRDRQLLSMKVLAKTQPLHPE